MAGFCANSYDFEINNRNRKTKINNSIDIELTINEKMTYCGCCEDDYGNDWFYEL